MLKLLATTSICSVAALQPSRPTEHNAKHQAEEVDDLAKLVPHSPSYFHARNFDAEKRNAEKQAQINLMAQMEMQNAKGPERIERAEMIALRTWNVMEQAKYGITMEEVEQLVGEGWQNLDGYEIAVQL